MRLFLFCFEGKSVILKINYFLYFACIYCRNVTDRCAYLLCFIYCCDLFSSWYCQSKTTVYNFLQVKNINQLAYFCFDVCLFACVFVCFIFILSYFAISILHVFKISWCFVHWISVLFWLFLMLHSMETNSYQL